MFQDPSLKRRQENSNGTGYATDDQVIIAMPMTYILHSPILSNHFANKYSADPNTSNVNGI